VETIGFVKVVREGKTARVVGTLVPYFDALYDGWVSIWRPKGVSMNSRADARDCGPPGRGASQRGLARGKNRGGG